MSARTMAKAVRTLAALATLSTRNATGVAADQAVLVNALTEALNSLLAGRLPTAEQRPTLEYVLACARERVATLAEFTSTLQKRQREIDGALAAADLRGL